MSIRYSPLAEDDLIEIAAYTMQAWNVKQADRYLEAIEACCEQLVKHPGIGRKCEMLRLGLRRIEQGSHVIFFEAEDGGVFIARILHKSREPEGEDSNRACLSGVGL